MSYVFENTDILDHILDYAVDKTSIASRASLLRVSSHFYATLKQERYWESAVRTLECNARVWKKKKKSRANRATEKTSYQRCKTLILDNLSIIEQLTYHNQKRINLVELPTCLCVFCSLLILWIRKNTYSFLVLLPLCMLVFYYTNRLYFLLCKLKFYLCYPNVHDDDYRKYASEDDRQKSYFVVLGLLGCAILLFLLFDAHFMIRSETWSWSSFFLCALVFCCIFFLLVVHTAWEDPQIRGTGSKKKQFLRCLAFGLSVVLGSSSPAWIFWVYLKYSVPTLLLVLPLSLALYLFHSIYRGTRAAKLGILLLFAAFQVCLVFDLCSSVTYTLIWTIIFLLLLCASVRRLF